jgi:hypothetical protein
MATKKFKKVPNSLNVIVEKYIKIEQAYGDTKKNARLKNKQSLKKIL